MQTGSQKPEGPRPFETGRLRRCPQGFFSPFFSFLSAIFCPVCLKPSLVHTICPLVSEDGHVPDSCIKEHLTTPFFRLLSIFRLGRKNFEILFTLKKIFTVSRVLNRHPPKHTPTHTHCYNYGPCLTLKSILHCFSQTLALYYCQYHSGPRWWGCCNKSVNNYNTTTTTTSLFSITILYWC